MTRFVLYSRRSARISLSVVATAQFELIKSVGIGAGRGIGRRMKRRSVPVSTPASTDPTNGQHQHAQQGRVDADTLEQVRRTEPFACECRRS